MSKLKFKSGDIVRVRVKDCHWNGNEVRRIKGNPGYVKIININPNVMFSYYLQGSEVWWAEVELELKHQCKICELNNA